MGIRTEEEKLARIAANLKRENKIEEQKIREKIRAAHEEVRRLAAQFIEIDPGIETIVLFGSLAENNVFSIHFDIDLAVRSEKYLQLVGCGLKSSFLRILKVLRKLLGSTFLEQRCDRTHETRYRWSTTGIAGP